MKDSVWYNKLWHNKMQKLPVEGDANAAWQKMQALLDDNMPASPPNSINKPGKSLGYNLMLLAAAAILAALLYYAGTRLLGGNKPVVEKSQKHINLNNAEYKSTGQKASLTSQNLKATGNNLPASENNETVNNTDIHTKNNTNSTAESAGIESKVSTSSRKNDGSTGDVSFVSGASVNHKNSLQANRVKNGKPAFVGRNGSSPIRTSRIFRRSGTTGKDFTSKTNKNTASVSTDGPTGSTKPIISGDNNTAQVTNPQGNSANSSQKTDATTSNPVTTAANQPNNTTAAARKTPAGIKPASGKKTKPTKTISYSSFEFGLNLGAKTNRGVFAGVAGTYYINHNLGIGIGANVSQRLISGSYSNSNYKYTFSPDTSKAKTYTADKLVVTSSQKIYTIDVPVLVTYKVSRIISLKGGAVISIPLKTGAIKNNLGAINNPVDTIKPYKVIDTAAHSTTINSRVNFSLSGGIHLNLNRFSIDADYVRGLSPYTTSSSLGSGKSYYHTFQFGVGFILFKTKKK
jgi:hypothetical protein